MNESRPLHFEDNDIPRVPTQEKVRVGSLEKASFSRQEVTSFASIRKRPDGSEDAAVFGEHSAIVTDGMGGRHDAAAASEYVANVIHRDIEGGGKFSSINDIEIHHRNVFTEVNQAVRENFPQTGTTAVAISLWKSGQQHIGVYSWTGDARLYLVRGNSISRLTQDRGMDTDYVPEDQLAAVLDEVDRITTWEELANASDNAQEVVDNRRQKLVPRHIGNYSKTGESMFDVQTGVVYLQPSDKLLLLTDGVTDNLTAEEILENSNSSTAIAEKARARSSEKCFRAVQDDITVFVGEI